MQCINVDCFLFYDSLSDSSSCVKQKRNKEKSLCGSFWKGRNVLMTFNLYRVWLRSLSVSTKVSNKRVLKIDWKRRDCCFSCFSLSIGIKSKRSRSSPHDFRSWIKILSKTVTWNYIIKGPHSPTIYCASRSANLNFVWIETLKKLLRSVIIVFFHYNRILHIYFNPPV